MRKSFLGAALAFAGLAVAAAPASAVYDDGVRSVALPNPNPGAVSTPLELTIGKSDVNDADTALIQIEVPGFALNPGTAAGQQIGTVTLNSSVGPIGSTIRTAGPKSDSRGTAHQGSWAIPIPAFGDLPIYIDLNKGLVNGVAGDKAGSTLVTAEVPPSSRLPAGAKLQGAVLRLNVDEDGCPTAAVGITNPSAPGTFTISSVFVPYGSTGQPDPAAKSERSVPVAVQTGNVPPTPTGCAGSNPPAKISVTPKLVKGAKLGQSVRFMVKNTGGPATYEVLKAGKRLRNLPVAAGKTVPLVFKVVKADLGKTIQIQLRPARGQTGNAASARYQAVKPKPRPRGARVR